jgi:hypothetical protein
MRGGSIALLIFLQTGVVSRDERVGGDAPARAAYFFRLLTASLSCLPTLNLTDLAAGIRILSLV